MGLFTLGIVAAANSGRRSRQAAKEKVAADFRKRKRSAAAPLFRAAPTRKEVAEYLRLRTLTAPPAQAEGAAQQLAQLRAGYPYEVTANPSTGNIRVQIYAPRIPPNPYAVQAAKIQAQLDANPLPAEWRRNPDTWTTQQEIDYNHHVYMADKEQKRRQAQKLKERDERDAARYKRLR